MSASSFDGAEAAIAAADARALQALRIQHFGSRDDRSKFLFSQGRVYDHTTRHWNHHGEV